VEDNERARKGGGVGKRYHKYFADSNLKFY
jgi:hypothetical protein